MAKRSETSGKYVLYSEYLKEKIEAGEIAALPATALKPEVIQSLIRSYTGFQKSEANREFNASVTATREELDGEVDEAPKAPRRKKAAAAPAKKRARKAAAVEPEPEEEENGEEEVEAPRRRGRPRKATAVAGGKRAGTKKATVAKRRKPAAEPAEEVEDDAEYAEF